MSRLLQRERSKLTFRMERLRLMRALWRAQRKFPALRTGQLIINAVHCGPHAETTHINRLFYITDGDLAVALDRYTEEHSK